MLTTTSVVETVEAVIVVAVVVGAWVGLSVDTIVTISDAVVLAGASPVEVGAACVVDARAAGAAGAWVGLSVETTVTVSDAGALVLTGASAVEVVAAGVVVAAICVAGGCVGLSVDAAVTTWEAVVLTRASVVELVEACIVGVVAAGAVGASVGVSVEAVLAGACVAAGADSSSCMHGLGQLPWWISCSQAWKSTKRASSKARRASCLKMPTGYQGGKMLVPSSIAHVVWRKHSSPDTAVWHNVSGNLLQGTGHSWRPRSCSMACISSKLDS